MPSILDRELDDKARDAFGHQDYANALRDLIEAPSNKPPFSIGLLGPWGTGKSTIKALYRKGLEADKRGPAGNRRADRIHVISFNAWRFGGEQDLRRALLRDAFRQLGGDDVALRRELFEQVNRVTHERRSFGDWWGEAFGQLLGAATILLGVLLVSFALALGFVSAVGLTDQITLGVVFATAFVVAGWLGRNVVDLRMRAPAYYLPLTSVSFPTTSAEEYERLLTEQIELFRQGAGRHCNRLVVFVDDLDRLSAPEMVAGLDAIRTFLELPFNTAENGFGVVFVISCDEDRVAEAIKGRGRLGTADLPGAVFTRGDARRYLDRLFQYRLEIPQFPKQDMRQFALRKLSELESISNGLRAHGIEVEAIIDRLIHVDVQSPRNAIQLLNAFIQSWWIATDRERNGVGSTAPGALSQGAVTDHPLSLAALCVLRVDFPDFYDCVQTRPDIIQEFRSVVFGAKPVDETASEARGILKDFLVNDKGTLTSEVAPDHRKLRRYLSSLADLRWPKRLQPLLRLAEDPITRKYGDRAAGIFDSLVSGDVEGILEAFNRNLDNDPLSAEDASLLEGFGDELAQETESRRTNAARVLAALVDRIPPERKRRILSPLIRQMVALKAVRTNIQPSRARQIIDGATTDDRQDVAVRFIDDLLTGQPLSWRLATGGEPNLDEATQAVRDAAVLALEVKKTDGLPPNAAGKLRDWLLSREVQVGGQSNTLPLSDLEGWLAEHADHLLVELGADYSNQVIGEFERSATAPSMSAPALPRIASIFKDLATAGQLQRHSLWAQLTRLIAVQSPEGAQAAWIEAVRYSTLPNSTERCAFLVAFATRLNKDMTDDKWGLAWEEGAQRFCDLAAEWAADIDAATAERIEPLVSLWGETEGCEEYAARALDVLKGRSKETWDRSVAKLADLELSDRPEETTVYLGMSFGTLPKTARNPLIAKMDALIATDAPEEAAASAYGVLVKSLPASAWAEPPLSEHLVRQLDRVGQMHGNPAYLTRILPISISLFKSAPTGKVAQMLTPLFNNAAGAPKAYVALHRVMKGQWPTPNDQIGDYKPSEISERACQFIETQASNKGIVEVYGSVVGLAERGLSGPTASKRISDVTPIVWHVAPASVVAMAGFLKGILEPSAVAQLLLGDQSPDLVADDLTKFLGDVAGASDRERREEVVRRVIAVPPTRLLDQPDGALRAWVTASAHHDQEFVVRLLDIQEFNDAQRHRIVALADNQTFAEYVNSVKMLLLDDARPLTRTSLLGRLNGIVSMCGTEVQRSNLAAQLISALPSLAGEELHTAATSVAALGGSNALERSTEIVESLDDEQRKVIAKAFPTSKRLKDGATQH